MFMIIYAGRSDYNPPDKNYCKIFPNEIEAQVYFDAIKRDGFYILKWKGEIDQINLSTITS